ncbi:uncharacterized protein LOC144167026 isoform X2 [Haemaphysalis longicornis]
MWRHPVRQSADPAAAETGPDESSAFTGIQFTYGFEVQTNMTRTPCTSMYSAVLLSLLLAVVVGSPTQPARNIPDPSKGMQPVGATQADLLSHEEPDGVMVVKGNHVRSGKKVSRRSYAALSKPQVDKFLPQVPVARHFPGYFAKHLAAGSRHIPGQPQVPPPSGQGKRLAHSAHVVCPQLKATWTMDMEHSPVPPKWRQRAHEAEYAWKANTEFSQF